VSSLKGFLARNSASQILAQASDAKAIYLTPGLSYALTTTANPVQPGQGIEFTVTVTNLSSVAQPVTINYDVPKFTATNGYQAGRGLSSYLGTAAPGATLVLSLDFTVLSGTAAPPDGSLITAVISDQVHGALVSCTAIVRTVPAAVLELSTAKSPASSGGSFTLLPGLSQWVHQCALEGAAEFAGAGGRELDLG
jgi:hypothetical protein